MCCTFKYGFIWQDPHADEFEDKEWTFFIENVSLFKSRGTFFEGLSQLFYINILLLTNIYCKKCKNETKNVLKENNKDCLFSKLKETA